MKPTIGNKYGNWEEAKINLNHLPEPLNTFRMDEVESILGYPVQYITNSKGRFYAMQNPKLNVVYIRNLGELSSEEVASIINS